MHTCLGTDSKVHELTLRGIDWWAQLPEGIHTQTQTHTREDFEVQSGVAAFFPTAL